MITNPYPDDAQKAFRAGIVDMAAARLMLIDQSGDRGQDTTELRDLIDAARRQGVEVTMANAVELARLISQHETTAAGPVE